MIRTLIQLASTYWLAMRWLVVATLLMTPQVSQNVPDGAEWIGVLGGGGGARCERAARAAKETGLPVFYSGDTREIEAARRSFAAAGVRNVVYLTVQEVSTYGCVDVLRRFTNRPGVLVTDASHAYRTQLAWLQAGSLEVPPPILPAGNHQPVPLEVGKVIYYLFAY